MRPRARYERAVIRNRRRGWTSYDFVTVDPDKAMMGIRHLDPADLRIIQNLLELELLARIFAADEEEDRTPAES